jgi:hypothetical protein
MVIAEADESSQVQFLYCLKSVNGNDDASTVVPVIVRKYQSQYIRFRLYVQLMTKSHMHVCRQRPFSPVAFKNDFPLDLTYNVVPLPWGDHELYRSPAISTTCSVEHRGAIVRSSDLSNGYPIKGCQVDTPTKNIASPVMHPTPICVGPKIIVEVRETAPLLHRTGCYVNHHWSCNSSSSLLRLFSTRPFSFDVAIGLGREHFYQTVETKRLRKH